MSVSFQLDIKDTATPALKAKIAQCRPERINSFVGPALKLKVRHHFLSLPHNKRGWGPVNFWPGAASSTNFQIVPEGVVISVSQIGVRQRYQGGTIRPVNAKALTIPVAEESYGKTVKDFGDQLQLVVIKGKGAWLALKSFEEAKKYGSPGPMKPVRGKKQIQGPGQHTMRERLKFLFMLSAGVTQAADPNVLPSDAEIAETAIAAAEEAVK